MKFKPFGIIPPVITPFLDNGKVDIPLFRRVMRRLLENGVHGMFPLGTTGEFWAVTDESEYVKIMEAAVEEMAGKIPVYAGANHITATGVIRLIKLAEKAGADAISVLTPSFVSQTQEELFAYFNEIAASTSLPILVYNNPVKTNINVAPETMARLAEIPNIVAAKDSSQNFSNTMEYIRLTRHRDDFHVLLGTDMHIYGGLCCGAAGAIASGANVTPRLLADVYDRFIAGDHNGALDAQMRFGAISKYLAGLGSFPAAIKAAMELQGVPAGPCATPINRLTADETDTLRAVMAGAGLIKA